MKIKFSKIISLILVIASLLSCFTVFSFADGGDDAVDETKPSDRFILHYNRTYDEGWDVNNGEIKVTEKQGSTVRIDRETLADFSNNNFVRYTSGEDTNQSTTLSLGYDVYPTDGITALEFDIKTDDVSNMLSSLYMCRGANSTGTYHAIINIKNNELELWGKNFGTLDEWVHIAIVAGLDQTRYECYTCGHAITGDVTTKRAACQNTSCAGRYAHTVEMRMYVSAADNFDYANAVPFTSKDAAGFDLGKHTYYFDHKLACGAADDTKYSDSSIYSFRFNINAGMPAGHSFCLDNVKMYSDPEKTDLIPLKVTEDMGIGTLQDPTAAKTVSTDSASADPVDTALIMKVGSNHMLLNGVRKPIFTDDTRDGHTDEIYGRPVKVDGVVYVPLEVFPEYTSSPIYAHSDKISYDVSTSEGVAYIAIERDVATIGGERVQLAAAPMYAAAEKIDNFVYPVIALADVEKLFPGYFVTYDEMGLIAICKEKNIFNRDSDLRRMVDIMGRFIFDHLTGQQFYDAVSEYTNGFEHPYIYANQETYDYMNAVYTSEAYDPLYKGWLEEYVAQAEKIYDQYDQLPANPAHAGFKTQPAHYKVLMFEITNPYDGGIEKGEWLDFVKYGNYDYGQSQKDLMNAEGTNFDPDYMYTAEHWNGGYDFPYGYSSEATNNIAEEIRTLAMAYQITRDENYARMAYELSYSFTKFRHWGQGHFLECGGTGEAMGHTYDMLHNIWKQFDEEDGNVYTWNTEYIAQMIYEKAIFYGYQVSTGYYADAIAMDDEVRQPNMVGTVTYNLAEMNWNATCCGGMTVACLSIIGEEGPEIDYTKIATKANKASGYAQDDDINRLFFVLEDNFKSVSTLGQIQFAPDGSFIESPSYWGGTIFDLMDVYLAVYTATGDDLGLYETWGMDQTFYFAIHTEHRATQWNSKNYWYNVWMFHDTKGGAMGTDRFLFAAQMLNDPALIPYRIDQIKQGKPVDMHDLISYKPGYADLTMDLVALNKDHVMYGIDAVTARDGFDGEDIFVGLIGNQNNAHQHAQVDSGAFIYVSYGTAWFCDLGSDDYAVFDYFTTVRYNYYRNNAEGHNTICITSDSKNIPYGQVFQGGGEIVEFVSDDKKGMYSILDNTTAYGEWCTSGLRGMMMTNDRKTVVIQDEINFSQMQSFFWIAHTAQNISLSEDGRTALMTREVFGESITVRVSLVAEDPNLSFELISAANPATATDDEFLLEKTNRPHVATSGTGKKPEMSRAAYQRLIIRRENKDKLQCAVVIETFNQSRGEDPKNTPVGYTYTPMNMWSLDTDYSQGDNIVDGNEQTETNGIISNVVVTFVKTYGNQAIKYLESGYAFTTRNKDFFVALAHVSAAVNTFRAETVKRIPGYSEIYEQYLECLKLYNAYKGDINDTYLTARSVGEAMLGQKAEIVESTQSAE